MRQSPMLNYPAAEFEARMADAARKVREAGLDCIMGTSKMVVCHLTGLRSVVWKSKVSTPGLLFLCADGRYGLVCSYGGIEAAMYSTCLEREDFYSYDYSGRRGVADNFFGALCYTLRHFGIDTGRLGCEFGPGIHPHMDIAMLDALRAEFPEMECVNATDLVWNILADKSEAQLADLRHSRGHGRPRRRPGQERLGGPPGLRRLRHGLGPHRRAAARPQQYLHPPRRHDPEPPGLRAPQLRRPSHTAPERRGDRGRLRLPQGQDLRAARHLRGTGPGCRVRPGPFPLRAALAMCGIMCCRIRT